MSHFIPKTVYRALFSFASLDSCNGRKLGTPPSRHFGSRGQTHGAWWTLLYGVTFAAVTPACGSDFDSQMTLSGYRVVGVEATPPEVSPDDTLVLRVHEFNDGDEAAEHKWTLCLYSIGAIGDYECASPELEYAVGDDAEVTLDLGPDGLDLRRVLTELPTYPTEDGIPRSLDDGFSVWVKLRSGPDCRDCRSIDTVKRLTLSDRPEQTRNHNPVIDEFAVATTARRGATVTLSVDVDEPEPYVDSTGRATREEYLYTWYTSNGKAKPTRSFGDGKQTELELPPDSTTVEVVVTVRDERGGLAVARRTIDVE